MLATKTFLTTSISGATGSVVSSQNFLQYDTTTNQMTYQSPTSITSTEPVHIDNLSTSSIGTSSTTMTGYTVNLVPGNSAWTLRTTPDDAYRWIGITFGNGLYVAVSDSGGSQRVMTSRDGITWTLQNVVANNWRNIVWGNNLFVAVAYTGASDRVMTSPDGVNWTTRVSAQDNQWLGIAWGNGIYVAVANTGSNRVMTSPDGINWTGRNAATANDWVSVTFGNGIFVAVSFSGVGNRVMTSADGITWTSRTSASDNEWQSVTWGNNLFVAVAGSGTGDRVMTSPDGITWTSRQSAADIGWRGVVWGSGLFVAVALTGTGNRVMTSPDGISWTLGTTPADNQWIGVTYGNGRFVATSLSGTNNRVMTWDGGILNCGQIIAPIITAPFGNNLQLEGGGTGFTLESSTIHNSTTAVSANVAITGSTGLFQRSTSSIRYKTEVENMSLEDAQKVWDLRPVWYRSTCPNDPKDWSFYGLIAEEVADIEPRLVFWSGGEAPPNAPEGETSGSTQTPFIVDGEQEEEDGDFATHETSPPESLGDTGGEPPSGGDTGGGAPRPEGVMYDRIVPMFLRAQKEEYARLQQEIQELKKEILDMIEQDA